MKGEASHISKIQVQLRDLASKNRWQAIKEDWTSVSGTHTHMCTQTHTDAHTHGHMDPHVHTCPHTQEYTHRDTCLCSHTCTGTHGHTLMHTHAHLCTPTVPTNPSASTHCYEKALLTGQLINNRNNFLMVLEKSKSRPPV